MDARQRRPDGVKRFNRGEIMQNRKWRTVEEKTANSRN
jgi:hypothetical protein